MCDGVEAPNVEKKAQIVLIGEVHDNPHHHCVQGAVIADIGATAIVFEMLTAAQAERFDARLDDAALDAALSWSSRGWPDLSIYAPVFERARDGAAQVFGGAVARSTIRAAYEDGAAAVFSGDAEEFGLTDALPPEMQVARETLQFQAHCEAIPRDTMGGFVEVQRLRDAELALAALKALDETAGPVAVILGNGHARADWGVPALLRQAAPEVEVVTIGLAEEDGAASMAPHFDIVDAFPGVDRGDPCEAFSGKG